MIAKMKREGERGNMIILAMILLAVLSIIGAAAVMLSSQERRNMSAVQAYHKRLECARAAQMKIWSEMGSVGAAYLKSSTPVAISSVTLPNGTQLQSPGHYNQPDATTTISSVTFKGQSVGGSASIITQQDLTNFIGLASSGAGDTLAITAHCTDNNNNQYEVELSVVLPL
jgi:hypothetical protein